jgi:predicted dehydrogenase
MSKQKISIGLVGVANHGNTILNAIMASPNLTLASCFDTNTAAAAQVGRKSGARVASSYDDLVNDPNIDAVALVTPNQLHADQARKAAAAGKHVFVEKPITNSIPDARTMIDTFRQAKLVLMVGHNTRRRLVFRRAKEILTKGMIGKVVALEGNLSRPAGLQPGLPPWKADPKACPLLPMTQLGIHLVDTAEYLVGPVQTVSCVAARIAMPGNVYDTTAAVLQLESGVPFALSSYYVSPDAYYLRIYGTNGLLHCYPTSLRLELTEGGEPKEARDETFQEGAGSYNLQMQEFGDCILQQREPETGGREGLRALAVIEAMTQSVAQSTVVRIADILS